MNSALVQNQQIEFVVFSECVVHSAGFQVKKTKKKQTSKMTQKSESKDSSDKFQPISPDVSPLFVFRSPPLLGAGLPGDGTPSTSVGSFVLEGKRHGAGGVTADRRAARPGRAGPGLRGGVASLNGLIERRNSEQLLLTTT